MKIPTPIYPMAMIPSTNMTFKLYFLAFPKAWKSEMLQLQISVNPKFNTFYNMNTHVLYDYLKGWLENVVQIKPIKQASDDTDWFVSVEEPDTEKICEILQIWITAEYVQNPKSSPQTKTIAERFMEMIDPNVLKDGIRMEEAVLFDEEGRALSDYAFNAFSLYSANALKGKTITVFGQELTFSSCGANELISQPISDGRKQPHYYAIGLRLSLQTTPPQRSCMLLIDCSVKRFISDVWKENIYLKENIHAYVSMEQNKYRKITLYQGYEKDEESGKKRYPHFWSLPEQKCYNLYNVRQLPNAEEVLHHPEQYLTQHSDPQIMLPYKFGMDFANMRVETGVSVKDKSAIFQQLCSLMHDFAEPINSPQAVEAIHFNEGRTEKVQKQKLHRERLKSCTRMTALTIELYGYDSDDSLKNQLIGEFENYFGSAENDTIFPIHLVKKNLNGLGDMMEDSTYKSHCQRIEEVKRVIPRSETIIGAIVILPDTRDEVGDSKQALRAGFADTNRLTQFITPECDKNRVKGAVMDMLRQFGYSKFIEKRNTQKNPAFDSDAVGIHVMHELKPLWAKSKKDMARFLPVYITYQVRSGKIVVDCDIFERRHLSYPEALLEFSRLSRNNDFTKRCTDSERSGLRTKLLGLQALYRKKPALILIQANGTTRYLWNGITDKKISEYHMKEDYIPEKIDIGTKAYFDLKDFGSTEVRIMRIRENQSTHEVPDYYTEAKETGNHISSSGIYQYKDVFWALENRPNNKEYKYSYIQSKFENPTLGFDECGIVEFFPIQLQQGDRATQWVAFSNYLREIMPETNRQAVKLPAPLHFAELMKEYLLLASHK